MAAPRERLLVNTGAVLFELKPIASAPDFEACEDDAEVLTGSDAKFARDGILDELVEVELERIEIAVTHVRDAGRVFAAVYPDAPASVHA
jgi:hypothetical protein